MLNAHPIALHIFGAAFFIGRILHAMGMAGSFGQGRLVGTLLTLLTFLGQAYYSGSALSHFGRLTQGRQSGGGRKRRCCRHSWPLAGDCCP